MMILRLNNLLSPIIYGNRRLITSYPLDLVVPGIKARARERIKRKESNEKITFSTAHRASLKIIQNGSFGFYRSAYLSIDQMQYAFNFPESNQRLFTSPFILNVFFTHGSWQNFGGLANLMVSMRSMDAKVLHLHGPSGVKRISNSARILNEGLSTKIDNCRPSIEEHGVDIFEDSNIIVESVPLTTSVENERLFRQLLERLKSGKIDEADYNRTSSFRTSDLAVAYICTLKPKSSEIALDKCLKFGIYLPKIIELLKKGETVKSHDGRDVHPDELKSTPSPADYFAVVECPNENYLDALTRSEAFTKFYARGGEKELKILLHFTSRNVMETEAYQNWMKKFPSSTKHWICNDSTPSICHLEASNRLQTSLHSIHEEIFPLLWHQRLTLDEENLIKDDKSMANTVLAIPTNHFLFRPPLGFQPLQANLLKDTDKSKSTETKELENFHKLVAETKLNGEIYPQTTFFGTGSSIPRKYRNVSSILLELNENRSIIFDCGESTVTQMQLFYGPELFPRRLIDLKAVFISHLHLDHYYGLYSLIFERKLAYEKSGLPYEKLIISAPWPLLGHSLEQFSKTVQDLSDLFDFYSTSSHVDSIKYPNDEIAKRLDLQSLHVVYVLHHCYPCGFVLTTNDWKKIVYSGDTRPCPHLIHVGRHADLLIHEATYNDGWEGDALATRHCTKSEAIEVAKAMQAKRTILTHFTASNAKVAYIDERIMKANPNVGVAYDFMTLRWEHLELIPKMVPVFNEMFNSLVEEQKASYGRRYWGSDQDENKFAKADR